MNGQLITFNVRRIKDPHNSYQHLDAFLTQKEIVKANLFRNPNDAAQFRIARTIIRKHLENIYKITAKEIPLSISEQGKPFCNLANAPSFSISHCNDLVVVGWSNDEIGVDVEPLSSRLESDADSIWLTAKECDAIQTASNPSEERLHYFVAKESILKLLGSGFLNDPRSIKIERKDGFIACDNNLHETSAHIQIRCLANRWLLGVAKKNRHFQSSGFQG